MLVTWTLLCQSELHEVEFVFPLPSMCAFVLLPICRGRCCCCDVVHTIVLVCPCLFWTSQPENGTIKNFCNFGEAFSAFPSFLEDFIFSEKLTPPDDTLKYIKNYQQTHKVEKTWPQVDMFCTTSKKKYPTVVCRYAHQGALLVDDLRQIWGVPQFVPTSWSIIPLGAKTEDRHYCFWRRLKKPSNALKFAWNSLANALKCLKMPYNFGLAEFLSQTEPKGKKKREISAK